MSVLLLGGCVTIVLEEQGDGQAYEPSTAADEAGGQVQVEIADEQEQDVAGQQMAPDSEDTQGRAADPPEDVDGVSDSDGLTSEEKEYADERLSKLKEEARRRGDAVPLDDFDSREMLEILDLKIRKISPSRGSIEEILFAVRNFGDAPMRPKADFRVETLITNPDFPRVERVEFDLKEIPPGMKIEKRAYLNIEFRPLGYGREWNLRLLGRNYPPNEIDAIAGRFRLDE